LVIFFVIYGKFFYWDESGFWDKAIPNLPVISTKEKSILYNSDFSFVEMTEG